VVAVVVVKPGQVAAGLVVAVMAGLFLQYCPVTVAQ
jgi:hypothetical protein